MLKLISNAVELLLAGYREWRAAQDRKAARDAVTAQRASAAARTLERERAAAAAADAAGADELLDLNDRLRDRAKRN